MSIETLGRIGRFIHRDAVGFFAPVIALIRVIRKPGRQYLRQLRVIYRYTFGK